MRQTSEMCMRGNRPYTYTNTQKKTTHTPVHIIVVTELSKSYHNEIKAVKFRKVCIVYVKI